MACLFINSRKIQQQKVQIKKSFSLADSYIEDVEHAVPLLVQQAV